MNDYFWYAAGVLSGVAAAFIVVPLLRKLAQRPRVYLFGFSAALVVAFASAALLAYRALGRPDALDPSLSAAILAHAGARAPATGESVDSLESAANKLEERLMRDGGSDADWQLLAQSYDFLQRPEDAARARAQTSAAPAPPTGTVDVGQQIAVLQKRVQAAPRDADAWAQLATLYRRQRNFEQARAAYGKLIELDAMNADSWADYADALATLAGGSLAGEAARAIDRALAIDAQHAKALWLKASLAHEQRRYRDSLALWKKLRDSLPEGSPDVEIVEANIAEAALLAGQPASTASPLPAPLAVQVTGTVSVDKALAARVAPGATLYIYAKAADSPGPPLAVLRTSPTAWPVSFKLDDTLAMLPARKLSDFSRVIVEARLSRSGQAKPEPGDLYVQSPVLAPADGKKLELVISRVIS